MELQSLKLLITDDDLMHLVALHLPKEAPVEDLRVCVTAEGVRVSGSYPLMVLKVTFETVWSLLVVDGEAEARLTALRVAGLPAGKFKGLVLKLLRDELDHKAGITIVEEGVRLDVQAIARREGVPLRVNLKALHCEPGRITVLAGGEP
jgi:hypothetical protein